ncbi:hypothetical protein [Prauserella cavernicola]|uniref:Uncharacterized protein n=1 Tax=Prauserella cavernicola TaxID=2800127 RepID=A0A934QRS1_9PSEU|nr:hypothetical protein [Prauserella cavernicola]MBK1785011.1 hypothetical protein [Prauserella cavernicola]
MSHPLARGLAAGAAGVTALNTVTYLDMALRGRAASSTPERTVDSLASAVGLRVPGVGETRRNRLTGLGAVLGTLAGTAVGVGYGALHALGWRPSPPVGALAVTAAAMVAGSGPMTALGITDPRGWSATDWLSDVLPHLAYGAVTAATYRAMEPAAE